ncbi:disease resistance protein RPV1 [Trifolium repens]|nr:disease resistance protein RPV1 [Trifolium repens]
MSLPKIAVGRYEVGRTIGEGTFAKVKHARDIWTGQSVALKILDKEKVLKNKMGEQIMWEIATMKLIKHPNVVRLYEVMGSRTKIYIVLEFVTGGDLFDKIRITMAEILDDEWFKKDYKPPVFEENGETNLDDVEAVFKDLEDYHVTEKKEDQPTAMNAFDLISMSSGLNLENLFVEVEQAKLYDVFLSFRGVDSRATFISHLDSSLQNAGIYVFKDDDGIQRGEKISNSLFQAISQSRISIVILSRNYANSKWCMMELERIVEISRTKGGMVVVPVFYEVDPSEVRNQTGEFGKAFDSLISTKKVDKNTKMNWKTALKEIGGRAGVVIINSRDESEDIKKIVEHVTRLLDKTDLFVAEHPVGVKSRVEKVIQLLNSQKSKDPLLLGIWGMGGIGKTTLAKAVYNKIRHDFDRKCFLFNVGEVWKLDNDKVSLQQRLLSDIYQNTKIKIDTVESGKRILPERLRHLRIFLVIDNVNESDQLNALCGNRSWFGKGSRIIITTRDEELLSRLEVDHVFRMKGMDASESLKLFNWHAFKQPIPRKGFTSLSKDVVSYCEGLPLALQVIGSFLLTKSEAEWNDVLEKLNLIPDKKVTKVLKISFDGLPDDDMKEIFLDVAFFFIGMDREDVNKILKDCGHFPEIGISTLVRQSLITVDRKNKIGMHDLLRDMGREIVRMKSKEGDMEPSRIWRYEDVLELSKDSISLNVKGLTLKMPRLEPTCLETKAFEKMDRLKLLQFAGIQLDGDYKVLSKQLRWLCWHGFPLEFIPGEFHQGCLVVLELKYSNLKQVWRKAQLLVKLKILNLSHSHNLRHTPDFSYLPNLEKLILKECPNLSSVSSTIGKLKKILLINLKDCTGLRELPRSIYKLDSLKTLILSGCTKIDKLEEDIEQMKSLTTLVADNTAITSVPFALARSKSIAYISLCGYEGFAQKVFPSIIQSWLSPTNSILSLVQTFAGTPGLDFTDEQNQSFYCLPSTFEDLQDLQRLWLECDSKAQLNQTVASILYSFNTQNCEGLSNIGTTTSIHCRSQVGISSSKNSLTSFLIQMGMSCNVTSILTDILQKIPPAGSGLLPGDNSPNWLTFNSNDSSVTFEVPQADGRNLKTIMCIVYSSSAGNATTEGFKVVLVINYTKNTIQVYKRDALLASFDEEEWQRVIANIEPGNKIKFIVGFTNEFIVKKTTIYLVYEPNEEKKNYCHETDENGIVFRGDENRVLEQIVEETHLSSQTTVPVGQQISQVQLLQTFDLPKVATSFNSLVSGSVKSQTRPSTSDPSLPKETSSILSHTGQPQEKEGENQSDSRCYSTPHPENDVDNQESTDSESSRASSPHMETTNETEFPNAIQADHEVPPTGVQISNVVIPPNIPIDDELQTGLAAFNIDLENNATVAIESFLSSLGFSSDPIVSISQSGASFQLTTTVESLVQELRSLAFDGPPFDSLSSILALDQSLDSFKQQFRVHQHLLPASQLEGFTAVLTNLEDIVKTYRGYEQERTLEEHSESEVSKFVISMNESKDKLIKYQELISDFVNRDKEIITKVEALKKEIEGLEMEQGNLKARKESAIENMNFEKRALRSQAASLTAHQSQLQASRDKLSTLDHNLQQCKATHARFKEHPPF